MIFASVASVNAEQISNEYGFANGWFNGQEATVKNVKLKIGEPAEIKLTVTSNISGNVYVKLTNPLVTEPFQVITCPSVVGQTIPNSGVTMGWSKTYTWTLSPTGAWKNGNAPINALVSFSKKGDQKPIEFTIANPYILDEQYTGATQTPQPTGTVPGATIPIPKAAPLPALGAIAMLIGVWLWKRLQR